MLGARRGVTAMVTEREMVAIEVDPGSELAEALAAVDEKRVVLVSNGRRYAVSRARTEPEDDADQESFRAAIRAAAGTFTPEEAEELKQNIYRWREEGSRPLNRP
jgi:hypothetical protein